MIDLFRSLVTLIFHRAGQLKPQGHAFWILWSAVDSLGIYFWFDINLKEISFILLPWTGIKMVSLGFGALEGPAKEGASIWHAREKCPILAQRFLEHRFFEAVHT